MNLGGAADEAYRSHAEPPTIKSLLGGGDHRWVIGQAEVVVGAEIDQHLIADLDPCRLRRADHRLRFVETLVLDRRQVVSELIF